VGWKEGFVGKALVGTGIKSQAGFTLVQSSPVIVEDLRTETRFSGTQLLTDRKITSGINVVILGKSYPFGILSVHTLKKRIFS
jgi:hypothetical protein